LSHLDFDIPNMEFTLDVSSHAFLSGDIRISSLGYIISTKDYVRIYKLFMQNKANFIRFSPENDDFTKKQTQLKPIQSQFNPIQSQFKPKQTQFKPNFTTLKGLLPKYSK